MNCAIFCLFAFCAFQTVLANQFKQDLDKLRDESAEQVKFITNIIKFAITTEVDDAEKKGINTGKFPFKAGHGCLEISNQLYYELIMIIRHEINKCLDKADKTTEDIMSARSCCEKAVVGLEKDAKVTHAVAKACVAKCPHSDCTKMTIKQFQDMASKKNE